MRLSFPIRLYLCAWASLLTAGLLGGWFAAGREVRALNEDLESRLMSEGTGLASCLYFSMQADDDKAVRKLMAAAVSKETIVYATVKRYKGMNYMERDGQKAAAVRELFFLIRPLNNEKASAHVTAGGPVPPAEALQAQDILGELRLGVSYDEIAVQTRKIRLNTFGRVAVLIFLVGLIQVAWVRNILHRDLKPFLSALMKIADGPSQGADIAGKLPQATEDAAYSFDKLEAVLSEAISAKAGLTGILETMTDPLVVFDLQGNIRFVNRATPGVLGYEERELLYQPMNLIVSDSQFQSSITACDLAKGPRQTVETTFRTKDGQGIPMLCSLSFLEEKGGEGGVICLAVDMTSWKARESELKEARAGAERMTRELTLLNRKLELKTREAEDMAKQAQAASVAKSEFLANMSHEIRTPLNGIIGITDLLLATPLAQEQQNYLEMIRSSGDRLLAVVNDILDFSRIEANRLQLDEFPFNLRRTIDEALKILFLKAREKGIDVTLAVDADVPEILVGDQGRFSQIVINLVHNSVKFTREGSIHVFVRKEEDLGDGRVMLHVSVRDTGIGVPEEKWGMIFESFVQADTSHAREFGGAGLGLAISSQLVKMMGGRIWLERETGEGRATATGPGGGGSTFHFTAGFRTGNLSSMSTVGRKAEPEASPAPPSVQASLHILLVEDDFINRSLAVTLIESRGWRVTAVENGEQALRACRETRFDCALMDVQMPVMDGYAATRAIREFEKTSGEHLPVIAMTAHALKGDREKCLAAGMDEYLTKPVGKEEMFSTVERLASASRQRS